MKQTIRLFTIALIAGAITLGGYKFFIEDSSTATISSKRELPNFIPTNVSGNLPLNSTIDFTEAAQKTVDAVVHVKNTTISNEPTSIRDLFFGGGSPRSLIGHGSGVIINKDGYIITNNHVIENANELEVTLNDNKIYKAQLVGTDPKTDIALIKVDSEEDLPFVPFTDSNDVKIGEWVLAVGNPFNLTSTVTAGIVSAKARDLNEFDGNPQSFIQTDAAVNKGNSGGALVNTQGLLVGINTAITSETGNFVGYSFAVPSNTARKVVEDIMEYGNVQRAILGIVGGSLNSNAAEQLGINDTEGVYIEGVEKGSGADKGGLKKGDVIKDIDGQTITKFSDLSGYLGSKRPNDIVKVTILREGRKKMIPVTLVRIETYKIDDLGIEIRNVNKEQLKEYGINNGVIISGALTNEMRRFGLENSIITKVNDTPVNNINDVKNILNNRDYEDAIKMTFVTKNGEINSFIFR